MQVQISVIKPPNGEAALVEMKMLLDNAEAMFCVAMNHHSAGELGKQLQAMAVKAKHEVVLAPANANLPPAPGNGGNGRPS